MLDRLWERVRRAGRIDRASLAWSRVFCGVFMLLGMRPEFAWIGQVPDTFFDPPLLSPANLFDRWPAPWFFVWLDRAVLVLLVAMTAGLAPRTSTALLAVALLVGESFSYSFGTIEHLIMLPAMLVVMAFVGWGGRLSLDPPDRSRPDADLGILMVIVAVGFLSAGLPKLSGWVDLDLGTSGFQRWLQSGVFNSGRDHLLAPRLARFHAPLLWEVLEYGAVLFELLVVWAILERRRWNVYLGAWCLFHLFNSVVLNIAFAPHMLVMLVFVPWSSIWARRPAAPPASRIMIGAALLSMLVYVVGQAGLRRHDLGFEVAVCAVAWSFLAMFFFASAGWSRAEMVPEGSAGRVKAGPPSA